MPVLSSTTGSRLVRAWYCTIVLEYSSMLFLVRGYSESTRGMRRVVPVPEYIWMFFSLFCDEILLDRVRQ